MRTDHIVSPPVGVETDPNSIVCRWDSPDAKQRVILSPSLVLHLRQTAIEAFLAIPRRGIEIGGLLLGQVRHQTDSTVFEIAAFEEVPCEHRFGPSYVLDDLDRTHLAELLARQQRAGSPPVIGIYRSYTGREARLDDADLELIRTYFPGSNLVCLLLQPLSMQKSAAGFRFWRNGELLSEPAYLPFPFEAEQMKQEVLNPDPPPPLEPVLIPVRERARVNEPEPALDFVPAEEPVVIMRPYRRVERRYEEEDEEPGGRRGILLPLICCLLLAIAAVVGYQLWKISREPRFARVHLDAKLSGREWQLNWDPAATAVARATRGILTVNDGPAPQDFALSRDELRGGRFGYTPSNSDVLFLLRLYDRDSPVAEDSLRVVGVSAPPPKPGPAPIGPAVPRVLYQVDPVLAPAIRARIERPMSVNIAVTIDRAGHVIGAWPKTKSRGLERYLADAAVRAARLWTFAPSPSRASVTFTLPFEFLPN